MADHHISGRQWWVYPLAAAWLLLELLFLQAGWASAGEGEIRAQVASWMVAGYLFVMGLLAWLWYRRSRTRHTE